MGKRWDRLVRRTKIILRIAVPVTKVRDPWELQADAVAQRVISAHIKGGVYEWRSAEVTIYPAHVSIMREQLIGDEDYQSRQDKIVRLVHIVGKIYDGTKNVLNFPAA